MYATRPDGRGEGVTETPRIDLCAAHAQEAAAGPAAVDDDDWGAFVAYDASLEESYFSAVLDEIESQKAVPMVMVADGHGEVLIDTPASAFPSTCYAVPETSAVQQPVLEVHSKRLRSALVSMCQ